MTPDQREDLRLVLKMIETNSPAVANSTPFKSLQTLEKYVDTLEEAVEVSRAYRQARGNQKTSMARHLDRAFDAIDKSFW